MGCARAHHTQIPALTTQRVYAAAVVGAMGAVTNSSDSARAIRSPSIYPPEVPARRHPDGTEVVAYCRGPYCVFADEAVRVLAKKGVTAARPEDGFPEWAAAPSPGGPRLATAVSRQHKRGARCSTSAPP